VAHGSCVSSGKQAPNETLQRELADELRNKVADELIKRRDTTEWFIEGDFDNYVERMRQPHVWGGEPELLMLSHVLEYDSNFGWLDFQTLSFACPCSYHIAERWRRASAVCVNKGILYF
jgi:hypothetical protein